MSLLLLPLGIFVFALIFAAFSDANSMTISNKISLIIMVAFALAMPIAWDGWAMFAQHMAVGLAFFVAGFVMFAVGGLGGGDAKLMAATALWWTWPDALLYIFYTTLFGGLLALFLMVGKKYLPVSVATNTMVARMFTETKKMPYGIALAAGALAVLPGSDIVQRVLMG